MEHPGPLRSGEKRHAPIFWPGELDQRGYPLPRASKTSAIPHRSRSQRRRRISLSSGAKVRHRPGRRMPPEQTPTALSRSGTSRGIRSICSTRPTGIIPVASSGAYTGGGRWSYPLHPYIDSGADLKKVFYRVTGDDVLGTFLGTFVSVNGVDRNKKDGKQFRVCRLGQAGYRTTSPGRRSDRCGWHPSARRHLQLHFLRNSRAGHWSWRWSALQPGGDPRGHPRGAG